jgi:hypothetical protein
MRCIYVTLLTHMCYIYVTLTTHMCYIYVTHQSSTLSAPGLSMRAP